MSASPHPSIQGLIELARRDGVDIRPTLVRVLADLYVQEPAHAPAERARFAELTYRLLDGVDAATRAAVAERLAPYPGTPAAVASRLAHDDIRVADPILRRSPVLGESELHSILDTCGIAHAIAIASRANLPASVAKRLHNVAGARGAAPQAPVKTRAPVTQRPDTALTLTLARRFFVTGGDERRLILTAMPACPPIPHEERMRLVHRSMADRLERAALRHQPQEFIQALHQSADLPAEVAAKIVGDPGGEPMVAVCRAFGVPFNTTSRILLFLNPVAGASVRQVFALSEQFDQIPPLAARRLVGAWCEIGPPRRTPRREPLRAARDRFDPRMLAERARALAEALPAQRESA